MRKMEWAARPEHLGGVPRKIVFMAVGAHSLRQRLICSIPPQFTTSNPIPPFRRLVTHCQQSHVNVSHSLGKCIPIMRGGGIYQEHMNEARGYLRDGSRVLCPLYAPIQRLKWGTASLIVRVPITPIVLPVVHDGFRKVMPEEYIFSRRPPFPSWNRDIRIVIGEPMMFDIPTLKLRAVEMSRDLSCPSVGWPNTTPCGLDEAAQRYPYNVISERIQAALESLRNAASLARN